MATYDWPAALRPNVELWHLDARTRSGGETLTGREQAVDSGLSRWIARVTVPIFTRPTVLAARALIAKLRGRANVVMVGPCDCRNAPLILPAVPGIPYSDQAYHSDGAGFQQGDQPALTFPVGVGGHQIRIALGATGLLAEGVYIGLAGYLYMIVGITPDGDEAILDIVPRLRTAVEADEEIEWCAARAPMRLLADDSGALELSLARMGTLSLDLVEVY